MSFNSPETSQERQDQNVGNLNTLTESQQQAVTTILAKIDNNPEIGNSMKIGFGNQFHDVTHDPEKLWKFLDAIQNTEQAKLLEITHAFNAWRILWETAKIQAHDTVTRYGHLALTALKDSIQTQTA